MLIALMNLRQLRERANLSPEEVAYKIGKAYSTIMNWESGKTIPTLGVNEMGDLCRLYKCSFEELEESVKETRNARGIK